MNLQLHILLSLRMIPSHLMMPVETLWAEVRMKARPEPSRAEFDHALREMEDEAKEIIVMKPKDGHRAKITSLGFARLQENGI